jgi:hypothetical protein
MTPEQREHSTRRFRELAKLAKRVIEKPKKLLSAKETRKWAERLAKDVADAND